MGVNYHCEMQEDDDLSQELSNIAERRRIYTRRMNGATKEEIEHEDLSRRSAAEQSVTQTEMMGYEEVDGVYCKYFVITVIGGGGTELRYHMWEDYQTKTIKQFRMSSQVHTFKRFEAMTDKTR